MPEFLILTEILKNLIFLKPAFSLAVSFISIFVVFILIKVPFSQKLYKVELHKNRSNFTKDLQKATSENGKKQLRLMKISTSANECVQHFSIV